MSDTYTPFNNIAQALAARSAAPSTPLAPTVDPMFFARARALASQGMQASVPLTPAQGASVMPPQAPAQASPPQPPVAPAGPPQVPVSLPNNSPAHQAPAQMPWWASGDMTKMFDHVSNGFASNHPATAKMLGIGQPPPTLAAGSSIPGASGPTSVNGAALNAAGPASVGGAPLNPAPSGGFFARNTAMMPDPMGGGFIDPTAAQAAASGPSLIDKMLAHLQNKDMG